MIIIRVEGLVASHILSLFENIFKPRQLSETDVIVFVSYAEQDVPKGFVFTSAQDSRTNVSNHVEVQLVTISQQFSEEWDEIPTGWNTVCLLRGKTKNDIALLSEMPILDHWTMPHSYYIDLSNQDSPEM
ncbi:MAG: hypothetical protein ABWZ25_00120 [Chitinophagaceae bacterium]